VPKRRRQLGRRDSEEAISRAIAKHFSHIPTEVIETAKVDGLLVRDKIRMDRKSLSQGEGLGASYWVDLAGRVGRGCQQLEALKPSNQDMSHSNRTFTLTLIVLYAVFVTIVHARFQRCWVCIYMASRNLQLSSSWVCNSWFQTCYFQTLDTQIIDLLFLECSVRGCLRNRLSFWV
jgi:hypothetical protein